MLQFVCRTVERQGRRRPQEESGRDRCATAKGQQSRDKSKDTNEIIATNQQRERMTQELLSRASQVSFNLGNHNKKIMVATLRPVLEQSTHNTANK